MKLAAFFLFSLIMGDFFFGAMIAPFCQGHLHIAILFAFNAVWIYYLDKRLFSKVN